MSNTVIEVKDLSIRYRLLKRYSIKRNLLHKKDDTPKEFEAVKGVSFSLEKGDILGLVGKNGSGKSTLLKAVGGIFAPNEGSVDLHGHSVSLLAVGLGFQRDLSGRENILLTGMLMGFSEKEIQAKMEEIVTFSELGAFIDRPVRTYSSGMHSKLSFAIAVTMETDIILVDEVLSVGDARFKQKSFAKLKEMISHQDRTAILVSHSSSQIRELCNKVLWIDAGETRMFGDTKTVMDAYDAYMKL